MRQDRGLGKILVVGNDPVLLKKIKKCLVRKEWNVFLALERVRAFELIQTKRPCLLIVDYLFQQETSGNFMQLVKDYYGEIPFIVMTSLNDELRATQLFRSGARDYLIKEDTFFDRLPLVIEKVFAELENEQGEAGALAFLRNQAAIVAFSEDAVIVMDSNQRIRYWNLAAKKIYGFSAEEMLGEPYENLLISTAQDQEKEQIGYILQGSSVNSYESRHLCKNGNEIYVSISLSPMYGGIEIKEQIAAVIRNITVQKTTELELRQRLAFESILMGISETMFTTKAEEFDKKMIEILARVGEFIHCQYVCVYWLNQREEVELVHHWQAEKKAVKYAACFSTNAISWWQELINSQDLVKFSGSLFGRADLIQQMGVLIVPMITQQRMYGFIAFESEQDSLGWLEKNWSFLKLAGELLCNVITRYQAEVELDRRQAQVTHHQVALLELFQSHFASLDQALAKICSLAAETLVVERVSVLLFAAGMTELQQLGLYVLSEKKFSRGMRLSFTKREALYSLAQQQRLIVVDDVHSDPLVLEVAGEFLLKHHITSGIFVCLRSAGQLIGVVSFSHIGSKRSWSVLEQEFAGSIADRIALVLSEQSLQESMLILQHSERRYRTLMQQSSDGILLLEASTEKVVEVNRQAAEILGFRAEFLQGKVFSTLFPFSLELDDQVQSYPYVQPTGQDVFIEMSVQSVDFEEEEGLLVKIVDVTAKRTLEERLQQAQKLEAIGTLTGGIAHDFNNILAAILGYTELLQKEPAVNGAAKQYLQEVMQAALRAKALVSQIMSFSNPVEGSLQIIAIKPILEEIVQFLRATIPTTIQIQSVITDPLLCVEADPTRIFQILMNLSVNAEMAMREAGGTLELSLTAVTLESAQAKLLQLPRGQYVVLSIKDSGCGIKPEIMNRIFDPYFTTKGLGGGTGLGLAVVHGLVKSYGGVIAVESEWGRGSLFQVYLPRAKGLPILPEERWEERRVSSNAHILFVDDEPVLVKLHVAALEGSGYVVTGAIGGVAGYQEFIANPAAFDIVIIDQTMPELTGEMVAQKIWQIRSDLPILLCSGYSHIIDESRASTLGFAGFLQKPVLLQELINTIELILQNKPPLSKSPSLETNGIELAKVEATCGKIFETSHKRLFAEHYAALIIRGWVHQLRQPLAAIALIGNNESYWRSKGKLPSLEQYGQDMQEVVKQAQRLEEMLQAGNAFFPTAYGEQVKSINICDALQDVLQILSTYLARHRISVVTDWPIKAWLFEAKSYFVRKALTTVFFLLIESEAVQTRMAWASLTISFLTDQRIVFVYSEKGTVETLESKAAFSWLCRYVNARESSRDSVREIEITFSADRRKDDEYLTS